ncbi:MAG: citramalate synthase [Desulfatibacillaceae bacterium]
MEPVWLLDTTLRDGTQGEDINFSAEEKLRVAKRLDDAGIHYIEGGWPGSNPRDEKFFQLAREHGFANSTLVAFGSTRRRGTAASGDPNLRAIVDSGAPGACIFGKTWDLHVERIIEVGLEENLAMIEDSVRYLKDQGLEVVYDAEHYFDGAKANRDYAHRTILAALAGGADFITLCDTNGGTMPYEIEDMVREAVCLIKKNRDLSAGRLVPVGIHAHNDCGLAVANSIAAVRAGAQMVHGTVNGYGERCGNADIVNVIPVLQLKMGRRCLPDDKLAGLRRLSRWVSEAANMIPKKDRPFVGENAFAHKGGIHVSAVRKIPEAYEHMDPELVGNRRRVLISDMAGKSNVEYKARELGIELAGNGEDSRRIVGAVKNLENQGYQYDVAEGSFELLLKRMLGHTAQPFELKSFLVTIRKEAERPCFAEATIKISVNGEERFTAAEGDGPVSALDNALRRALRRFYPDECDAMRLVDFKVRVVDGRDGTAAKVKVFIESRDHERIWTTIGVSEDIIEASWQALADSFNYKLMKSVENGHCAPDTAGPGTSVNVVG